MRLSAKTKSAPAPRSFGHYIFHALWATVALTTAAFAQPGQVENRNRETSSRSSLGAPMAVACAQAAAEGRSDDDAVTACNRAVTMERLNRSNMIAAQVNRGAVYLMRRDGAHALESYDAVIALDDDNADAHMSRGIALQMLGRPGPAVAALTEALSLGVARPYMAYYYRAAAREGLGDTRGAYEDYRTALEIEPNWGPAFEELARFARIRRDELASIHEDGEGQSLPPAAQDNLEQTP